MGTLLNPSFFSPIVRKLYSYYDRSGLSASSSYDLYLAEADKFLSDIDLLEKEELRHLDAFMEERFFEFDLQMNSQDRYNLIIGFENFCKTVRSRLNSYQPEFLNMKGLKRSDLPNLKAFEFVGHNELKVSRESSNYALLYR